MNTETALQNFVAMAQAMILAHHERYFSGMTPPTLSVERGRKYAKIVRTEYGSRSVYCFVELSTGNVLKAASWKAPAKHARGNIFAPNPIAGVNEYGANYLV